MRPLDVLVGFVLVSALLLVWSSILQSVWTHSSALRSLSMRVGLFIATLAYLFFGLEILFYSVFAVSDSFGFTLAAKRWEEKYWMPVNSFGYRDLELGPADFRNREVLFVVGDSLVAGHGIPHVEDRLTNVLQKNLGEGCLVVNVAKNGWDTADEYRALVTHPYKPAKIILVYYINDILGAADRSGYGSPVRVEPPRGAGLRFLLDHSYSLNFAYWRLYRFRNRDLGEKYWEFLKHSYATPDIWRAHEAELLEIVTYARKEGIELTVVIFPYLRDVRGSAVITSQVAGFLREHAVRVVDLQPLLEGREPESLVVNSMDAHPNEALNREVAEILTREIRAAPARSSPRERRQELRPEVR